MVDFAKWLQAERARLSISQARLAHMTRLAKTTIQKIEGGQTKTPGRATRHLIERTLALWDRERGRKARS